MLYPILGFLLVIYSLENFKKAFILFLLFRSLLNQNINLINIPGIPLLTLEFTLCLLFYFTYLIKRPHLDVDKTSFPLKWPFIAMIFSYFISSVFGVAGLAGSFTNLLKVIFEGYISVWLIWVVLKDPRDYIFLMKGITIVFLVAGLYGLYEAIYHVNPIMDYQISKAGSGDRVLDFAYGDDSGRGYRIRSIFFHAIGAGMNWALYVLTSVYLYLYIVEKNMGLRYASLFLVTIISLVCLYFTNSRGPIMFLLIGLIPIINIFKKQNLFISSLIILILVGVYSYNSELFLGAISIFDKSAQQKLGGSNLAMRLMQLDAALQIMKSHPLLGIGLKGLSTLSSSLTEQLLGLESMWLWIIIQQGFFGIIVTLFLIYTLVFKLGLKKRNKPVIFLSLAYFITYTMTSVPGFLTYLLFAYIFMFIKINTQWNNSIK